jgi:hypothetical protein
VQQLRSGFIRIIKGPTGGLLASLALAAFLGGVALAAPGLTPTPADGSERRFGVEVADGQKTQAPLSVDGAAGEHRVDGTDVSSEVRPGVLPAPPADAHADGSAGGVAATGGGEPQTEGSVGSGANEGPGTANDDRGSTPSKVHDGPAGKAGGGTDAIAVSGDRTKGRAGSGGAATGAGGSGKHQEDGDPNHHVHQHPSDRL